MCFLWRFQRLRKKDPRSEPSVKIYLEYLVYRRAIIIRNNNDNNNTRYGLCLFDRKYSYFQIIDNIACAYTFY